jgi:hypothetical protein
LCQIQINSWASILARLDNYSWNAILLSSAQAVSAVLRDVCVNIARWLRSKVMWRAFVCGEGLCCNNVILGYCHFWLGKQPNCELRGAPFGLVVCAFPPIHVRYYFACSRWRFRPLAYCFSKHQRPMRILCVPLFVVSSVGFRKNAFFPFLRNMEKYATFYSD